MRGNSARRWTSSSRRARSTGRRRRTRPRKPCNGAMPATSRPSPTGSGSSSPIRMSRWTCSIGLRVRFTGSAARSAEDHTLATARGAAPFAAGDRVQFTDNAWSRKDKEAGLVNGAVGTVLAIDTGHAKPRMTVELDAAEGRGRPARQLHRRRRPQGGRVRCHPPRLRRHHLQRAGQDPRPDLRISFALLARGVELRGADAASRVRGDFRSSRHRRRS